MDKQQMETRISTLELNNTDIQDNTDSNMEWITQEKTTTKQLTHEQTQHNQTLWGE